MKNYNEAYKANTFGQLIFKRLFSFDQNSKSKVNKKYLKKYIKGNRISNAFEIGCGYGLNLSGLPKRIRIVGTDISPRSIENCKKYFEYFDKRDYYFYNSDANSKIEVGEKFDIIICSHILEHLENDDNLLFQISELLKTNGVFLLNVPINEKYVETNHVHKYNKELIIEKLTKNSFSIETLGEYDKWSQFFLAIYHGDIKLPLYFYKILRLVFAITPLRILEFLGKFLPENFKNQQLIVICNIIDK